MPITVAMIEEKEFKTKIKGYDPVEVDEFLEMLEKTLPEAREESMDEDSDIPPAY